MGLFLLSSYSAYHRNMKTRVEIPEIHASARKNGGGLSVIPGSESGGDGSPSLMDIKASQLTSSGFDREIKGK